MSHYLTKTSVFYTPKGAGAQKLALADTMLTDLTEDDIEVLLDAGAIREASVGEIAEFEDAQPAAPVKPAARGRKPAAEKAPEASTASAQPASKEDLA